MIKKQGFYSGVMENTIKNQIPIYGISGDRATSCGEFSSTLQRKLIKYRCVTSVSFASNDKMILVSDVEMMEA